MQADVSKDVQVISFSASLSDGLSNQLLAFPQMYCIGVELSLLANLANGS